MADEEAVRAKALKEAEEQRIKEKAEEVKRKAAEMKKREEAAAAAAAAEAKKLEDEAAAKKKALEDAAAAKKKELEDAAAEKENAAKASITEALKIKAPEDGEPAESPRSTAVDPIEDQAQSKSAFDCGCIIC